MEKFYYSKEGKKKILIEWEIYSGTLPIPA